MKAIYAYKEGNKIEYIPTGGGYQRILVWFEDGSDWYVHFVDDLQGKAYIHKVINKRAPSHEIFSGFNLEVLGEEEFDRCLQWVNENYNYQGLYKGEKLDG